MVYTGKKRLAVLNRNTVLFTYVWVFSKELLPHVCVHLDVLSTFQQNKTAVYNFCVVKKGPNSYEVSTID